VDAGGFAGFFADAAGPYPVNSVNIAAQNQAFIAHLNMLKGKHAGIVDLRIHNNGLAGRGAAVLDKLGPDPAAYF